MEFTIHLKTLTPIWTGDIDRCSPIIRETGIIGCLRWWYEVIIRGLGGYACDPSDASNRCPKQTTIKDQKVWCNACDLFGMTGLARKFQLRISGGQQVYAQNKPDENINIRPSDRQRGWYLGAGLVNRKNEPISLTISSLYRGSGGSDITANIILTLMGLVSKWAGIGARPQLGYGVFSIQDLNGQKIEISREMIKSFVTVATFQRSTLRTEQSPPNLPDLKDFFFFRVSQKDSLPENWWRKVDGIPIALGNKQYADRLQSFTSTSCPSIPVSPGLKNQLRFNSGLTSDQQDFLFGFINKKRCPHCFSAQVRANRQDPTSTTSFCSDCGKVFANSEILERQAARVSVSFAYKLDHRWEVRIWGYCPQQVPPPLGMNRGQIVDHLYKQLTSPTLWSSALGGNFCDLSNFKWREFNGKIVKRCQPITSFCSATGCPGTTVTEKANSFLQCLLLY